MCSYLCVVGLGERIRRYFYFKYFNIIWIIYKYFYMQTKQNKAHTLSRFMVRISGSSFSSISYRDTRCVIFCKPLFLLEYLLQFLPEKFY